MFKYAANDDQVAICPNCGGRTEGLDIDQVCPFPDCGWTPDKAVPPTADGKCPKCGSAVQPAENGNPRMVECSNEHCPYYYWRPISNAWPTEDGKCPECGTLVEPVDSQGYTVQCPNCGYERYLLIEPEPGTPF